MLVSIDVQLGSKLCMDSCHCLCSAVARNPYVIEYHSYVSRVPNFAKSTNNYGMHQTKYLGLKSVAGCFPVEQLFFSTSTKPWYRSNNCYYYYTSRHYWFHVDHNFPKVVRPWLYQSWCVLRPCIYLSSAGASSSKLMTTVNPIQARLFFGECTLNIHLPFTRFTSNL